MASNKNIAFFGATGGCAAACLAQSLQAGHNCTALVRNSTKLTNILSSLSISPETISQHLTIIEGNVKDPIAVSRTLFPASLNPSDPSNGNNSVSIIISGLGSIPVWKKWSLLPSIEDPTLCADGMSIILSSLRARKPVTKPLLVAISTTGLSKYGRDYPLLLFPIYAWLLHVPHMDKHLMEEAVIEAVKGEEAVLGEYAVVRASLLTSGEALGMGKIRWQVEDGAVTKNAIGYTISRNDVGGFIFEEMVRRFEGVKERGGSGRIITVTY
ncbi:hypothetical protein G7Y89_g15829 [Cudoniella acicularis]|uniref:NAD(P)-binding domain-containing protein n=1 Tax=Cudoniella acicularis TaxID=354080 RepID=A0A8H4VHC7_9HELO|nr:hypothetical protein G7Y89_g15829 [Cudoniella acicularis]